MSGGEASDPIAGADFLDETNLRKLSRILTAALRRNTSAVDDVTSSHCSSSSDEADRCSDVGRRLLSVCDGESCEVARGRVLPRRCGVMSLLLDGR